MSKVTFSEKRTACAPPIDIAIILDYVKQIQHDWANVRNNIAPEFETIRKILDIISYFIACSSYVSQSRFNIYNTYDELVRCKWFIGMDDSVRLWTIMLVILNQIITEVKETNTMEMIIGFFIKNLEAISTLIHFLALMLDDTDKASFLTNMFHAILQGTRALITKAGYHPRNIQTI
ncbi:MAG: hypothetical protein RLZ12_663 [Bacillota bacterium]|jgi:hypothetical protein